jgi:3-hydroxybutyryl-CoA dehydrogenase
MTTAIPEQLGAGRAEGVYRIGVVGSGTMGLGIAELCAVRGLSVSLAASSGESAAAAAYRLKASLDRRVARAKLSAEARDETLARVTASAGLVGMGECEIVIEAIPENRDLKSRMFAALDEVVGDDTILASTTSSISITHLAGATSRPDRVLGLHFFNPAPVLPLVEVVPTMLTAVDVVERARTLVTGTLGKQAISVPDRSGFVVNALLIPYLLSAIRMVESGMGTAETVDRAMELGCAHPMGPLRLSDFIGLDVVAAIAHAMYDEFRQPTYAPPSLLLRMIEAGRLGRKSGHGFYAYP